MSLGARYPGGGVSVMPRACCSVPPGALMALMASTLMALMALAACIKKPSSRHLLERQVDPRKRLGPPPLCCVTLEPMPRR